MSNQKDKPCPLCDSANLSSGDSGTNVPEPRFVKCDDCGCMVYGESVVAAEDKWNTRATQPATQTVEEAVEKIVGHLADDLSHLNKRQELDLDDYLRHTL